ncbi:nonstructural protein NSs [Melao virus]|uniref:Non-structural protein NS-S n=1 Tax=Melao virus TaxID=35515 RepID=Q83541_9VIRU|nr:nonstructural protein NSs [Melao virus]AAB60560.1 NSs protein [Melao virus]APA28996.1 nonstructural protein NSs [Melao virus]QIM41043.1 nonstructural protein [Melao virus]QIM58245.1 nonstructural protein NSs [Melao virus]QIM58247.1 nonstructural protein NSs [Melao virus]
MMSHQQVQMDLIQMQGIWHLQLRMGKLSICQPLGSSSLMPQKPKLLSLVNRRGKLLLNLETGRWKLSTIIFLETGTTQLVTTILPSIGFQDILPDGC